MKKFLLMTMAATVLMATSVFAASGDAALSGGRYTATGADLNNPSLSEAARKGRADFAARYADEKIFGKVELVNWGPVAAPPQ